MRIPAVAVVPAGGGTYCDICTSSEECYNLNDEPGVWCDDTNSCLPMGQTCCVWDGDDWINGPNERGY